MNYSFRQSPTKLSQQKVFMIFKYFSNSLGPVSAHELGSENEKKEIGYFCVRRAFDHLKLGKLCFNQRLSVVYLHFFSKSPELMFLLRISFIEFLSSEEITVF